MVNGILAEVGQIEVVNHAFHTYFFLLNKDRTKMRDLKIPFVFTS